MSSNRRTISLNSDLDDILAVSPVNSASSPSSINTRILSSWSLDGEMEDAKTNERTSRLVGEDKLKVDRDAFSSSSSSIGEVKDYQKQQSVAASSVLSDSEFDKAARKGESYYGHSSKLMIKTELNIASSFRQDDALSDEVLSNECSLAEKQSEEVESIISSVKMLQSTKEEGKEKILEKSCVPSKTKPWVPSLSNRDLLPTSSVRTIRPKPEDLTSGMLPDVLMTMRQKIESLTLFDSDMMKLAEGNRDFDDYEDEEVRASKESLRRSFQQSISAAVLVSLAHKRYDRRRLAAMEIEKVVRSLVTQNDLERVRAILLLLSDDYVRSTNEDARKGGVVALAACAIGLKKANGTTDVIECQDIILGSVVHACQDHSQRVRYYATESLFNVIKVIPALAIQHFFILFEILRSLYSDVDVDVRSGAQLLDKKFKEIIVAAINNGSFTADQCVPLFARYVHVRSKPQTKRLTLTWLEANFKLVGSPMLEFLHLFLQGIFAMVADSTTQIGELALRVLETILPQLLVTNEDFIDKQVSQKVDFDKILQSLVTTMEHPSPIVRKVAMYWMSRIVRAHMSDSEDSKKRQLNENFSNHHYPSTATISVRNSLPHVLPGILLSIGDNSKNDVVLPDLSTHLLAEQTNACLQSAVRRNGNAYISHLDGFILALREELDSPTSRNPQPAIERKNYRPDVKSDGTGIETPGWFRSSESQEEKEDSVMMSRLCALQWITVLYESVVPDSLKAEYAREFISPIIQQLVDFPPELIIFKSLQVLAKITIPLEQETIPKESFSQDMDILTDASADFALQVISSKNNKSFKSRDREVFAALIHLHSHNDRLLGNLWRVIEFMCTLQPPEFVFVSFSMELCFFIQKKQESQEKSLGKDLEFASCVVQYMNYVLLTSKETLSLRELLKDSIGRTQNSPSSVRLFHLLLKAFAHNFVSALSLCLWGGAFQTACSFLEKIDPLDINIMFYLELDQLIELLERPLFRHLQIRLLQQEYDSPETNIIHQEGSSTMLFRTLKSILMLLPQSTSYKVLRKRLLTVAKFRQSSFKISNTTHTKFFLSFPEFFLLLVQARKIHVASRWKTIRSSSLENSVEILDSAKPVKHVPEKNLETPNKKIMRHPDQVLPKDQIGNFQALNRHGLIHQASKSKSLKEVPFKSKKSNHRRMSMQKDGATNENWVDYWTEGKL